MQLGHVIRADGQWRLFVFADAADPDSPSASIRVLCDFLTHAPESAIRKFTPRDTDIDAVIDVPAIFFSQRIAPSKLKTCRRY